MAQTKLSRPSARDRILATASDLFYKEGVQNVGIDRIIAESGVAKMSLYNNFKSKDALIAAYLEQYDKNWNPWFQEKVEQLADNPGDRLLAIFDVLHTWFQEPNFRGCAFVNTTVELANSNHPGYDVAVKHKQAILAYIRSLVEAANLAHPNTLAQQLAILIEGAIVVAMMGQGANAAI
ncbi:MAG: TetR/AcrR family transcriptional regulator, partial [Cyanobacteria bacterium P01_A01_bin.37]